MPFDGSGSFLRVHNWVADAAGGIKILASRHDAEDQNLAAGLSQCITKDGQTSITADIPFNGKKITNLATPTGPADAATKAYVDTAAAASVYAPPVGCGMEFWGATAPPKWLLAYGQAISRVTYSQLFAVMGTTFGAGDGSTTFNIPDVRGRVVAGVDNMGGVAAGRLGLATLGGAGGAGTHVLTVAEMPNHAHGVAGTTGSGGVAHAHTSTIYVGSAAVGGTGIATGVPTTADISNRVAISAEPTAHTHTFSATSTFEGTGTAHPIVQPTIAANYIIYAGV